jgi:Asp/Glu/hydantoin racemase
LILLECTTFPSFAAALQENTGLPVVDYIGMINFVFNSVVCRRYTGFN